jgi:hypothetical protein
MMISKQNLTNSEIRVSGTITFAGQLVLNLTLGTNGFVSGEQFQLFSAATYSGAFISIFPPTPAPGFIWDTSKLPSQGILRVLGTQLPQLGPPRLTGHAVQIAGNGGMSSLPGDTYYVLTTTNVVLPISQWNRVSTGQLDANNNFLFTDPRPASALGSVYYRVQLR